MPTALQIEGVVTSAMTAFPGNVVTILYADEWRRSVSGLRHVENENDAGGLSGVIPGFQSTVRFKLSACSAADPPPNDGDSIIIREQDNTETEHTVLDHNDIGRKQLTATTFQGVRVLSYGEDSA